MPESKVQPPPIAFVIGWDDEITLQYEGKAEEPKGSQLERYKQVYFEKWADGREREQWSGITCFSVRTTWIRYSDFNRTPAQITEQKF